jgi:hypothetical protein
MPQFSRPRLLKIVACVCILLVLARTLASCTSGTLRGDNGFTDVPSGSDGTAAMSSQPGARMLSGTSGQPRWTVSIPRNASFPLRGEQYAEICRQGEHARDTIIRGSRMTRLKQIRKQSSYYTTDWTYMDVDEAERSRGLSPGGRHNVCATSLTFAMGSESASFGSTVLSLWLSYGLAKKEGRAFFVDDTRWAYGKYASYFGPPPTQICLPPPAHEIVPCPHQAKHLLVSAATAPWTFGSLFQRECSKERRGADKYKDIFDLLRKGYDDLFRLIGEDAVYANTRVSDLRNVAESHHGSVVGMHIRRGDLHPYEYQFSRDYLPVERYGSAASLLFHRLLEGHMASNDSRQDDISVLVEYVQSPLIMASDDPDLLTSPALVHAASPYTIQRAQERIQLATKSTLDVASPIESLRDPSSAYTKHVDENAGWEGGFYSALFYSLGNVKKSSSGGSLEQLNHMPGSADIPEQAMRLRELVGRAYLLDLAVLGQSDGVVCAVSSAAYRILGVIMGWDAVADGRWVNVDDGRPWSWDGRR